MSNGLGYLQPMTYMTYLPIYLHIYNCNLVISNLLKVWVMNHNVPLFYLHIFLHPTYNLPTYEGKKKHYCQKKVQK